MMSGPDSDQGSARKWGSGYRLGLLVICLLAFGLRLHLLEDIIFHDDEAVSRVLYVQQASPRVLFDYHPNNHWLTSALGHLLGRLGHQIFLLRWPSVLFGTLAVALLGRAGFQLFQSPQDGLVAALLLGLSAFHLQWSQQFRGYSALLFFALASFLLLHRALQTGRPAAWAGFLIAAALTIASHLYGVLMLLTMAAMLGSGLWRHPVLAFRRRSQYRWGMAFILVALGVTGYFIRFGKIHVIDLHHPSPQAGLIERIGYQWLAFEPTLPQVDDFLKEIAIAFTAQGDETQALLLFWGLALAGLAASLGRFPRLSLYLALWLLVPMGVVIAAEFALAGFFVFDRYFIFALPAWLLLAGRGLTVGSRQLLVRFAPAGHYRHALSLLLPAAGLLYLGWLNLHVSRAYFADRAGHDWRGVAAYLAEHAAAGDLAEHAAAGDLIVCKELPHRWPPPRLDLGDQCTKELERRLADLGFTPRFPIRQLEIVAALTTGLRFEAPAQTPGAVWLVVWGVEEPLIALAGEPEMEAKLAQRGASASAGPLRSWPDPITFNRLGQTALLRAEAGPTLVANLGHVLAQLARLDRQSPARFDYYLRQAQILAYQGRPAEAQAALNKAAGIPGSRSAALTETARALQLIANFNRPVTASPRQQTAAFGRPPLIRLTGYSLPPTLRAGQPVPVTVFWQALAPISTDYTVFLHLRRLSGQIVAQLDFQPFDGAYPTSHWASGSTITETRQWLLPAGLRPGSYTLHLGLYQIETLTRLPLTGNEGGEDAVRLGEVWVE